MGNGNKNIAFAEANAVNISAKFQLYPPYGFLGVDFLIFCFENLAIFGYHGNQSNSDDWIKMIYLVDHHSRTSL